MDSPRRERITAWKERVQMETADGLNPPPGLPSPTPTQHAISSFRLSPHDNVGDIPRPFADSTRADLVAQPAISSRRGQRLRPNEGVEELERQDRVSPADMTICHPDDRPLPAKDG